MFDGLFQGGFVEDGGGSGSGREVELWFSDENITRMAFE